MGDRLGSQLKRIVEAVEITSADSFTFAGRQFSTAANAAQQRHGIGGQSHPLVSLLEQTFYQHCYTRTFEGRLSDEQHRPEGEEELVPTLSAANSSRERWDAGWQIYQVLPSGQILAHKNGLTRALWPGEFISLDAPGLAPRPGLNISVFFMRESTVMQPGFYFAFGEAQDGGDTSSMVRFYWNVRPEGAAALVSALTRRLNRFQVPFRLKCLSNSAYFKRHDTSVLFTDKRFYHITSRLLSGAYREISEHLRAPAPLFTKRLADGLALAEEPYTGESFGMQRCRMLAEGVVGAHAKGLHAPAARLEEVTRQFERYGITLERPHLNPGSVDRYDFATDDA